MCSPTAGLDLPLLYEELGKTSIAEVRYNLPCTQRLCLLALTSRLGSCLHPNPVDSNPQTEAPGPAIETITLDTEAPVQEPRVSVPNAVIFYNFFCGCVMMPYLTRVCLSVQNQPKRRLKRPASVPVAAAAADAATRAPKGAKMDTRPVAKAKRRESSGPARACKSTPLEQRAHLSTQRAWPLTDKHLFYARTTPVSRSRRCACG